MGTQQTAGILGWGLRFAPNTPLYAARGSAPTPSQDAVRLCWNEQNEALAGSKSVNDVAGLKCQSCPRPVNFGSNPPQISGNLASDPPPGVAPQRRLWAFWTPE
jgi:hypothetical protein